MPSAKGKQRGEEATFRVSSNPPVEKGRAHPSTSSRLSGARRRIGGTRFSTDGQASDVGLARSRTAIASNFEEHAVEGEGGGDQSSYQRHGRCGAATDLDLAKGWQCAIAVEGFGVIALSPCNGRAAARASVKRQRIGTAVERGCHREHELVHRNGIVVVPVTCPTGGQISVLLADCHAANQIGDPNGTAIGAVASARRNGSDEDLDIRVDYRETGRPRATIWIGTAYGAHEVVAGRNMRETRAWTDRL